MEEKQIGRLEEKINIFAEITKGESILTVDNAEFIVQSVKSTFIKIEISMMIVLNTDSLEEEDHAIEPELISKLYEVTKINGKVLLKKLKRLELFLAGTVTNGDNVMALTKMFTKNELIFNYLLLLRKLQLDG